MIVLILFSINIMIFATSSWAIFWMLSEMATYMFISKISYEKYKNNKTDAPAVYMTISFLSSALMLALYALTGDFISSILVLDYATETMEQSMQDAVFATSLCVSLGMMPFHNWLFIIMEKMSWNSILILSTIQKIIPIWGIMMISNWQTIFLALILSSIMILFLPLKSKNMYFFLATSAIMNNMWIIMSCLSTIMSTIFYTIIYFIMTFNLMEIIKKFNLKTFNKFLEKNTMILIFSLIGIPPLLGFFSKMYIILSVNMINLISNNNFMLILSLLVISTSLVSYMYMKSFLPLFIEMNNSNLMMKNKTMKLNAIMMINLLTPLILVIMEIMY